MPTTPTTASPPLSIAVAASILARRALSILVELEAAAEVVRADDPDHASIIRGIDSADELHDCLMDIAARHETPGGELAHALGLVNVHTTHHN